MIKLEFEMKATKLCDAGLALDCTVHLSRGKNRGNDSNFHEL